MSRYKVKEIPFGFLIYKKLYKASVTQPVALFYKSRFSFERSLNEQVKARAERYCEELNQEKL